MGVYAISGGATGIGAAIKEDLRSAGNQVIVVDIKDADVEADLSTRDGRARAVSGIRKLASDGLDGFIACAGVGSHMPDHGLIARVNYFGTTELLEGIKDLVAAKEGSVVLISSNSAPMSSSENYINLLLAADEESACRAAALLSGQEAYSGSKQAVARWMRHNVVDYAQAGIRMNAVAPGYTQTPMTRQVEEDPTYGAAIKEFMASIPIGRPGQPKDIASVVSFLLGPGAGFICGAVMFVDGGHDAMLRPDQF